MPFDTETDVYAGRLSAWHNAGTVKGTSLSREDLENEGILFQAEKRQLEYAGQPIKAWGVFNADRDSFIATCSEDYAIHQAACIADTLEEIMGVTGNGMYETGGTLDNFSKVFLLSDIEAFYRVGDDLTKQYLAGVTSFDGSLSSSFFETDVRIVCKNTLRQALSTKTANQLKIRHTAKSHSRLADAREALAAIKSDFMRMGERMNFLASRYVNPVDMTNILEQVIKQPVGKADATRENMRHQNILDRIIEVYEFNDANAFPEQRGTAYNLLNAFTNYIDHERSTRTRAGEFAGEKRAASSIFGQGDKLKSQMLEVVTEYAQHNGSYRPTRTQLVSVPDMSGVSLLDTILEQ